MENNPNLEIQKNGYVIIIFSGVSDPMHEDDDNVDVQVNFDDGKYYTATFFTLKNIQTLFSKNKHTGECASGTYFFSSDMVIVEKLNMETIERVVNDLIENDELATAFDLHPNAE
jgi:hypothetical protein